MAVFAGVVTAGFDVGVGALPACDGVKGHLVCLGVADRRDSLRDVIDDIETVGDRGAVLRLLPGISRGDALTGVFAAV